MKKFLIGLACGFLLASLAAVLLVLAVGRLRERAPAVEDGTTIVLNLGGEIPERPPVRFPIPMLEFRQAVTVHQIWELAEKAAVDRRVRAIALMPQGVDAGWAKLDEIRRGLLKFRQSGKPVFAYLRNPGARDYYLATAADQIHMAREDFLDVKGLRAEMIFLRETLNKAGVQVEIEHAGKYKDAGDVFTRTAMSPETKEVVDSMLDVLYADFLKTVSEARGMSAAELKALIDEGPFLAAQAKAGRLVDDLVFEDQFYDRLKERLEQDKIRKLSYRDYVEVTPASVGLGTGSRIALVVGEGTILSGGQDGFDEEGTLRSRSFVHLLREVGDDRDVKGVILRIDSPGGDAVASDEMLREVRLLRDKKPMVISMSDAAASGGYFIAMSGDPILSYPHTFTGSIGVLFGKANLRGLYDKLGIRKQYLTRGRFAAIDSDYEPLSEAARAKLREGIDATYSNFLQVVSEGRRRTVEEIRPLAEGRVWLGTQAKENGLVDELGGIDRALELIRVRAGIPVEEKVRLVSYPRRRSLFEYLFRRSEGSVLAAELRRRLNGFDIRPFYPGAVLKLMPLAIEVR